MVDGITDTTTMESGSNSTHEAGAKEKAREMKDQAMDKAGDLKDQAVDKAGDLTAEARAKGKEMAREGKARARSQAEEQKERFSSGLLSMADALRRGGDEMPEEQRQYGRLLDAVADRAEDASHYLAERDVNSLGRDVRTFAREHTPMFLSGAFTLGVLGARFLKSSPVETADEREYRDGASSSWSGGSNGSLPAYETREPPASRGGHEAAGPGHTGPAMGDRSPADDRALEVESAFEGPEPYEIDEPTRGTQGEGGLNG